MHRDARLSPCRRYRYALWRQWDRRRSYAMFIGLNPSTANERRDDPTLLRCMRYARDWGYGGVCTANLFAFRATDPAVMKRADDPVGPDNDRWLRRLAGEAALVVAAWGNDGAWRDRSVVVRTMLPRLHCLRLNRSGEPAHPLYQRADLQPRPWRHDEGEPTVEDDRIQTLNPNTGRPDTRIRRALYDPVRRAILAAVDDAGEMAFKDLAEAVRQGTDPALWENASPGWYTTTVKLDLEARGEIERVPGARPQRIRRPD